MRVIEFRGRNDYGKWIYGCLQENIGRWGKYYYIYSNEHGVWLQVNKKTIGQYTGLKDRVHRRIYDGDLLLYHDEHNVRFAFVVTFKLGVYQVESPGVIPVALKHRHKEMIVIGNIHDNPEIVKEMKSHRVNLLCEVEDVEISDKDGE